MASLSSSDIICTSRCSSFQVKNKFRLLRIASRKVTWRQFILVLTATTADVSVFTHVQDVLKEKKVKKSPGVDGITPKLLKVSAEIISAPPSVICNNAISQCKYHLERTKIIPLTKSSDGDMKTQLFRQMTMFPALNNVFEKILASQLTSYFQKIFCDFLSAYRRHHSCQTILFIVEEWKKSREIKGSSLL